MIALILVRVHGCSVIVQNDRVTNITIKSSTVPALENGINVGSEKDELLALLPVEPEVIAEAA